MPTIVSSMEIMSLKKLFNGRMLKIQTLAKLMGVKTHVIRSVLERESCTADMARRIADALDVSVSEITKDPRK